MIHRRSQDPGPGSGPSPAARGFTLVEVMVALVIFAVGALTLAALVPLGTKNVSKSGEHTRASQIATSVVERLIDTPYTDPLLTQGTHTDSHNPYSGSYYASWLVEDDQPTSACKRITVTVRWPRSNSTTMVRLIAVSPESSWNDFGP